jgi:hypothetical protein
MWQTAGVGERGCVSAAHGHGAGGGDQRHRPEAAPWFPPLNLAFATGSCVQNAAGPLVDDDFLSGEKDG